ncbi:MAG: hypothetical protein ACKOK8_03690 [Planctomycetia bacterium]
MIDRHRVGRQWFRGWRKTEPIRLVAGQQRRPARTARRSSPRAAGGTLERHLQHQCRHQVRHECRHDGWLAPAAGRRLRPQPGRGLVGQPRAKEAVRHHGRPDATQPGQRQPAQAPRERIPHADPARDRRGHHTAGRSESQQVGPPLPYEPDGKPGERADGHGVGTVRTTGAVHGTSRPATS